VSRKRKNVRIVTAKLRRFNKLLVMTAISAGLFGFLLPTPQAWAQQPLTFENNYFVTGDYVVAGVGLRGLGVNGFATGTITLPDSKSVPSTGVPEGADIVGAFLYWATVESSQSAFQGQQGKFQGKPITGMVLGNPNAPVSWSAGGCTGAATGSKTIRTYRADVRALMPVNADGSIQANNTYSVSLADSGSNGGGTPLTLGASLVIIYRVLDKTVPLNAILLYDGAYAPSNAGQTMSLAMQGFYQPTQTSAPIAKLTHIVANGQSNKNQQVLFQGQAITPANTAAFPGFYNGSWDNPTYTVTLNSGATTATTSVIPSSSNSGCVDWGTVIMSTTVQDTDGDGLLDAWETGHGYCDATDTSGLTCNSSRPSWVALPGANVNVKDAYIQLDYMQDSSDGHSHRPPDASINLMKSAFAAKNITLHFDIKSAIQEQTCVDNPSANPPVYCSYPSQPGVVGWKGGFEFLKSQPLNYPDEASCQSHADCVRRFQHGRKDSYHYALFGHAMGVPNWSFRAGNLLSVGLSGSTASFTTSTPHGLVAGSCLNPASPPNSRFTVTDAITNPGLNGIYCVNSVSDDFTFTAQLSSSVATPATFNASTDPHLSIASGQGGTASGYSDVGGSDSLITLGLWGPDGQTVNTQAGTLMHEFGHSIALTHGGYYYDNPAKKYVPTVESNCKPNYQSVMNYLFQLDLLGPNSVLDYSGQQLIPLNETTLGTTTLTDLNNAASAFSTSKWYASSAPFGVGSPATHYCDGTPFTTNPPQMFRIEDSTLLIPWTPNQDINFDAQANTSLRGYNDWSNVDLRQISATGSDVAGGAGSLGFGAGSLGFGAGSLGFGAGSLGFGAGSLGFGAGSLGFGAGSLGFGAGQGTGEISFQQANSVVRPPRNLTPTPSDTRISHSVALNWLIPSFGQIASYNVYRADNPAGWPKSVTATTYTDGPTGIVDCTTYTYFASALLNAPGNPSSPPSNTVKYSVPCPITGLTSTLSISGNTYSVTLNWNAASTASGEIYGYNIYRNVGTVPNNSSTPIATVLNGVTSYTNQGVVKGTTYTYSVTAILNDQTGCSAGQHCRESTQVNTTITATKK
jgi:hypothetical protein